MISQQGKLLVILILVGLVAGYATSIVIVGGTPFTYYLLQENWQVYHGWYWQLFTSLLVVLPGYLGIADSLLNALAVFWLDGLIAGAFAPKEYFSVFVLSGLAGNILSLLNGPATISFGASGGIFGLLAGAVSAEFAVHNRVDLSLLGWFFSIFFISSFALPSADWLGHLGGSAFGLLAGYLIGRTRRHELPV
ncbi:MAG: rhomboid family intramembrane serine protease [Thaumarchaeota archaeon]|nr:rhomboid family intramembrane serine protease [Nitrososphaerota archaeon]